MRAMQRDAIAGSGVRVVSAVLGRMRLRAIDPSHRAGLAAVAEELRTWPDVNAVELRARSASVVVRFDAARTSAVVEALIEFGVDVRPVVPPPIRPSAAGAISSAASAGNRAVERRLGGTDLRVLVALGLGLLAARNALRGEDRLADAPWYVLAWYASETFARVHGDAPGVRGPGAGGAPG